MKRQNIQPDALAKRVVGGHTLYSHVVVVEARKTIFVAGQLLYCGVACNHHPTGLVALRNQKLPGNNA